MLPIGAWQEALREELKQLGVQCAPVTIRVVSNVETVTKFEQTHTAHDSETAGRAEGCEHVKTFPYRSKCILAFQVKACGSTLHICHGRDHTVTNVRASMLALTARRRA